jgi:hypothetical protein
MQTTYSVTSRKYITGQVAQTTNTHIDTFQLIPNANANLRNYAQPGDVIIRAAQGANDTFQVCKRGEIRDELKIATMIGIVIFDPLFGLTTYQSRLQAELAPPIQNRVDNTIIKTDILNVMRKGRIAVNVSVAVIAGDPCFPQVMAPETYATGGVLYGKETDNGSEKIGTYVTSALQNGIAVVEIHLSN